MTLDDSLNRLAKWRTVFAGWQLGTRHKGDHECDAVRDHREATILLRAEVSALIELMGRKGVFSTKEFCQQLAVEADRLSLAYERRFPGFRATDSGIEMDVPLARETMKGWRP